MMNQILRRRTQGLRTPGARLGCALLIASTSAPLSAQPRILIVNSDQSVPRYAGAHTSFKGALGGNIDEIDLAAAKGPEAALRNLIASVDPGVVYCIGSQAYLMTNQVAKNRQIIVSSAINVSRFPRAPRVFGIATEIQPAAQMTFFRLLFPKVRRIGLLYSADYNGEFAREAEAQDADLNLEIVARPVRKPSDLPGALRALLPTVDALWLIPDPVVLADAASVESIFAEADSRSKAIFAYDAAFSQRGAALAITSDIATIGRQAARLAQDLLEGRTPQGAVRSPAGSELTVNLATVARYKMELNPDALPSVNHFIPLK